MKKKISVAIVVLFTASALYSQARVSLDVSEEIGFAAILKHVIQSGSSTDKGDLFDYTTQGNQDTLFPFTRLQADVSLFERHHLILLYQPLTLETQAPISGNFRYDQVDYTPADGFIELTYAFDFWRFSYLFDIVEPAGFFLSTGLSLQIRNASIVFKASDSNKGTVTDNVGPVPIIKLRFGYEWDNNVFIMFDGDGFYASSEFFNGAAYPFMGYIYDLSLRGGYTFSEKTSAYFNIRFLGGGSKGTNESDQYTYNDLHTVGLTLGLISHM